MTSQTEFQTSNGRAVAGEVAEVLDASGVPQAACAASVKHLVSTASTNSAIVKAGAGRVLGWVFGNTTASWRYVRIANVATLPVPGTTTPAQTIAIPPNGTATALSDVGIGYSAGIGIWATAAAADADTTVTGVNDIVGDLFFA